MQLGFREALIAFAVVFAAFIAFKLRAPGKKRAVFADVEAARERARAAKTPRDKAQALMDAGRHAATARRFRAAASLFLRAMHADPTWPDPIIESSASLATRRPRWLEKALWSRLDALPWDAEHTAAARAAASALADLYAGRRRDKVRAAVLRRLAERLA